MQSCQQFDMKVNCVSVILKIIKILSFFQCLAYSFHTTARVHYMANQLDYEIVSVLSQNDSNTKRNFIAFS